MVKKTLIKLGILIIITCVVCFSDRSFATEPGELEMWSIARWLDFIISVLSWIWVLFAKLAGEFFTNRRVYGEIIGLDALFWQYWNITKNIANFCLGFYFVYVIFRGLIKQGEEIMKNIKDTILWILIAGVGIQTSWFLTAVVIDVSTVTLAAAGSLPAQIISQNSSVEEGIYKSIREYFKSGSSDEGVTFADNNLTFAKINNLFPKDSKSSEFITSSLVKLNKPVDEKTFFDSLVPNADNIAGPLYYMGYSILEISKINSLTTIDKNSIIHAILTLIVQGGTTIVYSIEMAVLCVLALMRLLYLWMFIVLSPIVVLLWCIKQSGEKKIMEISFVKSLMKQVNIKSFLLNVFKPTIIVLGIGLAMIFVTLMHKNWENEASVDLGGIKIITEPAATSNAKATDTLLNSTIDGGLIKFTIKYIGKGLLELIMSIITVVLVYIIIKVAVKMGGGEDFVSKRIGKVQDAVEGLLESTPIMPVAGYNNETGVPETHYMSAGKVFGLNNKGSLIDEKINQYQGKVSEEYNKQNQVISSWFGDKTGYLSAEEVRTIENAGSNNTGLEILTAKKNVIVKSEEGKGMTLNRDTAGNQGFWIQEFTKWLNERVEKNDYTGAPQKWRDMINDWKSIAADESKRDLKTLFDKPNHASTYAEFFGYTSGSYTNFDSIRNLDISKN